MTTCITGVERKPYEYFDIAFLGYNAKLTEYGLRQFAENNQENIIAISLINKTILFKDGTRIKGITIVDNRSLDGCRFDQLILFDDSRWLIRWDRAEDIHRILKWAMRLSNIPEKFQILEYEDIREV